MKVSRWAIGLLIVAAVVFGAWLLIRPALEGPSGEPVQGAVPAGAQPAVVEHVHDGDTLFLEMDGRELKVRLIGVDAPELEGVAGAATAQCWALEARQELRDLLPDGTEVWALADREELDRFGRSLFYLFTADGGFVNRQLVIAGAAEAVRIGQNDRFWDDLKDAELDARTAGAGMWNACPG